MTKIYVVTGAYGHLGNVVVRDLLAAKQKVRALVLPNDHNDMFVNMPVELYRGDITNKDTIRGLFEHTSDEELYVIHCAGIISIYGKYSPVMYNVNVNGTKNMVDLSIEYGVKRFLYVSSVHALKELKHGNSISEQTHFDPTQVKGAYAKTKAEATQYVLDHADKLDLVVVHPSGIIGAYDFYNSNTNQLFESYLNGGMRIIIKGGYDFVDVRDVSSGILAAMDKGRSGECYILSSKYSTVKEMFDILAKMGNVKKIKVVLPLWIPKLIAPIMERHYKRTKQVPLFTSYSLYTVKSNSAYSHEKATREIGYQPRDLMETMQSIFEWIDNKRVNKLTIKIV